MDQFIQDTSYDFELRRILAHARYRGSDTQEVIQLAVQIKPGDFESWYEAFFKLAEHARKTAGPAPKSTQLSSRSISYTDRMFAASNYYRAADFFLHGNHDDPRIISLWKAQAECFNEALKYFGNGIRHELQADGFTVPIIYFRSVLQGPRPTIIIGNGFDGSMEEMFHINGLAALERGYNVILYEGPGQPTPRRNQNIGFIQDWERVTKPIVDFVESLPEANSKIALFGYSLGGYLAVRAAAFEPRLSAAIAIDGVFDLTTFVSLPDDMSKLYEAGEKEKFNKAFDKMYASTAFPTGMRWTLGHGAWAYNMDAYDFKKEIEKYTLKDVIDNIQCPVFIGDAEQDIFFKGQPEIVTEKLGSKAHYRYYSNKEGLGVHCQVGAASVLNMEVFDWFEEIIEKQS